MKLLVTLISLLSFSALALFYSQYLSQNSGSRELEAQAVSGQFEAWKKKYGKNNLSSTQNDTKYKVFFENVKFIEKYNKENPEVQLAINEFADETIEEFQQKHLGENKATQDEEVELEKHDEKIEIPKDRANDEKTKPKLQGGTSANWKHRMPSVKNQGRCGSCWAFSAIGAIEGFYNTHYNTGYAKSFSEQMVLDCNVKNSGCDGGRIETGLDVSTVKTVLGSRYSYKSGSSGRNQSCSHGSHSSHFSTNGYRVIRNNPYRMMEQLEKQPLAIEIKQGQRQLQFYSSGIITQGCESDRTDHAVLIVGYRRDYGDTPYWIIRNSYGPNWGENGHMRVAIHTGDGLCGVNKNVLYPY